MARTAETGTAGETRRLAAFCADLDVDDLPADAVTAAREALVDAVGACYAGAGTRPGALAAAYASGVADGEATIVGSGERALPHLAALANGTAAHALEVDDGHRAASAHPGAAVVPAALAVGEATEASGGDVLTALVAGYEAMLRVAAAVQMSHALRGFHATATTGCFGAAAAASRLRGLSAAETADALGLAASMAGGVAEYRATGSMVKRLHPGRAALAGVMAADLAAVGYGGPPTAIEGEHGFAAAFADAYDPAPLDSLGDPFAITERYVKPYPCCRFLHAPIDAAVALTDAVESEDVAGIRVETIERAAVYDGTDVDNLLEAQFSVPYSVAVTLLAGGKPTLAEYDPPRTDADVVDLMEKVTLVATDEMEARYPAARPARVTIRTTDGEEHVESVEYPTGSPENPLSEAELREKFGSLTADALDDDRRGAVLDALLSVEGADDIAAVSAALSGGSA